MPYDAVHLGERVVTAEEFAARFRGIQAVFGVAVSVHHPHGVGVGSTEFRADFFPNNAVFHRVLYVHGAPYIEQPHKHGFRIFFGYRERGRPGASFVNSQGAIGNNGLGLDARSGSVNPSVLRTGEEPLRIVGVVDALETVTAAAAFPLYAIEEVSTVVLVSVHGVISIKRALANLVNLTGDDAVAHVLPLGVVGVAVNTSIIGQPNLVCVGIGYQSVLVHVQVTVLDVNPCGSRVIGALHADAPSVYSVHHHGIGFQGEVVPSLSALTVS